MLVRRCVLSRRISCKKLQCHDPTAFFFQFLVRNTFRRPLTPRSHEVKMMTLDFPLLRQTKQSGQQYGNAGTPRSVQCTPHSRSANRVFKLAADAATLRIDPWDGMEVRVHHQQKRTNEAPSPGGQAIEVVSVCVAQCRTGKAPKFWMGFMERKEKKIAIERHGREWNGMVRTGPERGKERSKAKKSRRGSLFSKRNRERKPEPGSARRQGEPQLGPAQTMVKRKQFPPIEGGYAWHVRLGSQLRGPLYSVPYIGRTIFSEHDTHE